jgi:hypothetical protein
MAINSYSIDGYYFNDYWLLVVTILMIINGYSIGGYWCLLMAIGEYFIGGYFCYYISEYWWLFY